MTKPKAPQADRYTLIYNYVVTFMKRSKIFSRNFLDTVTIVNYEVEVGPTGEVVIAVQYHLDGMREARRLEFELPQRWYVDAISARSKIKLKKYSYGNSDI